jgi:hypothetical protein
VIVIHAALGVAVHAHPFCTVTAIVPVTPAAGTVADAGVTLKVHEPPACVSANDCPAMVSVADRGLVVPFAATLYDTVPFPLPLAPLAIVAQEALLDAVHVQPAAAAVTATVPDVAPAATDAPVGAIVNVQGTPGCVTVNVRPAMATVPVRSVMVGFAAMLYATVPVPVPATPAVTVIHDALLVAVHPQLACVATATVPVAAAASTETDPGVMPNVHGAPGCVIVTTCPPAAIVPVRPVVLGLAATV